MADLVTQTLTGKATQPVEINPVNRVIVLLRRTLLVLGLLLAWQLSLAQSDSATAISEEASTETDTINLLDILKMDSLLELSIAQMLQIQIQQNPAIAPFENIMLDYLNKYMSYEQLKPDLVKIYSEAFSKSEIDELIEFYETPVGAKSIDIMPKLMQQGAQLGAARVQENIAELEQKIEAEVTRLAQEQSSETEPAKSD